MLNSWIRSTPICFLCNLIDRMQLYSNCIGWIHMSFVLIGCQPRCSSLCNLIDRMQIWSKLVGWMHFCKILIGCNPGYSSSVPVYLPFAVRIKFSFFMYFSFILIGCKPACASSVYWPDQAWTNSLLKCSSSSFSLVASLSSLLLFCILARSILNQFHFLMHFSFILIGCKPVCFSSVYWPGPAWIKSVFKCSSPSFWLVAILVAVLLYIGLSSLNQFRFLNTFLLHSD